MFYYKWKDNEKSTLCAIDKATNNNWIEITQEEYNNIIANNKKVPTAEYKAKIDKQNKINKYKNLLADTDYQAIKYAEGIISESEYLPIKNQRQEWRNKINELEEK